MTGSTQTLPKRLGGFPLRGFRVEVTRGPDQGKVLEARGESMTIGSDDHNDLVLRDPTVSRFHLELVRRGDRIKVVDHDSTNGTVLGRALVERGEVSVLAGATIGVGSSELKIDDGEVVMLDLHGKEALGGLQGNSPVMRRLMAVVERVAEKEASVLVTGESGTGKERLARALHERSGRKGPFVVVDCGAQPATLFSSELFGHERGAFTGAESRQPGAFERAHEGTLFFDEIGELPAELQVALLGALERRSIRRIGGKEEIAVDVRVVSATNRDLRSAVNSGAFRLDLFYRLAVVTLGMPPLRERAGDVPVLVAHFLREAKATQTVAELFPADTLRVLVEHPWPGNVRELRNVVAATLALGEVPALGDGEPAAAAAAAGPDAGLLSLSYREAKEQLLRGFEARYLAGLLQRTGGNVRAAAREAKMDRSHLIDLLRRHRRG